MAVEMQEKAQVIRKKAHPMRRIKHVLVTAAVVALVGAVCFGLGWLKGGVPKEESAPQISAVVLRTELESVSELATVSYHYTNMGQFENASEFYGVKLPFTTKSFILTYDGVIKAGVDLGGAEIRVKDRDVTVILPAARVLSHDIDEDSLEVFDEKTSIFNSFTVADYNAFQADQEKTMEAKAIAGGLLTQADEQAQKAVRSLLSAALPEGVALTVTSVS